MSEGKARFTVEEIAAALKTCARSDASACRSCPMGLEEVDGRCCFDALCLMAAELIEAQAKRIRELEEQLRWVPVTERLPDADDGPTIRDGELVAVSVLAVIEGSEWGTELYFDGDEFFDMQGDELILYRVTHWRPMAKRTEAGHE